jgi:hypothetical protein
MPTVQVILFGDAGYLCPGRSSLEQVDFGFAVDANIGVPSAWQPNSPLASGLDAKSLAPYGFPTAP